MECIVTEREIRIIGGLAFIFAILSVWMTRGEYERADLPDGFKKQVLAMEFVKTGADIGKILGPSDRDHAAEIRNSMQKDFTYIFAYALFFMALGLLLSQYKVAASWWLGMGAVAFTALAAASDFVEDYRILKVLRLDAPDDSMAQGIRHPALLKWILLSAAIMLIGIILLLRLTDWKGFQTLIIPLLVGLPLLLGGLLSLAAVVPGIQGEMSPNLLQFALVKVLTPGVLALTLIFLIRPQLLLYGFC